MYAVTVTIQVAKGQVPQFLPMMLRNAAASREEPGCRQFDVCLDVTRPDEVYLYELYTDRAAFDAHLATPHFKAFEVETRALIMDKYLRTYAEVNQ